MGKWPLGSEVDKKSKWLGDGWVWQSFQPLIRQWKTEWSHGWAKIEIQFERVFSLQFYYLHLTKIERADGNFPMETDFEDQCSFNNGFFYMWNSKRMHPNYRQFDS